MSPQKTIKVQESTYRLIQKVSRGIGRPMAMTVDLAIREIDSGDTVVIRKVKQSGGGSGATVGVNTGSISSKTTQRAK